MAKEPGEEAGGPAGRQPPPQTAVSSPKLMESSDTLVVLPPWSPQILLRCSLHVVLRHRQGTTPNQAPPRLSALGHQVYAETAASIPTLSVFLHGASLLSWPCVLEPSLSHCLLGSICSPHLSFLPHILFCHLFAIPSQLRLSQGLVVLPVFMTQGLTVLPISLS